MDPEDFDDQLAAEAAAFTEPGRLKRKPPPPWARRAVFFREHGRCAACCRDLTGLLDALSASHFDHIVPLAHGGLNDVSNLQLLCQRCNGRKPTTALSG
jgi:5-methylcytosine-specific restriction endonuclease McrA